MLRIDIEVFEGPLSVSLKEGPDLQHWSEASFSLTPTGPTMTHSPELSPGRYDLFVVPPAREQSFYQVYCE
jgi:hypothetical protein